ncbi:hypothetical protein AAF712_001634 [Marasmius tenuissimus]|uniref:Uncharacterized protein n=1 Tax=Marasmius tenuissimus TaxID=585030 RepID=A0ABR3AAU1_9AGAR
MKLKGSRQRPRGSSSTNRDEYQPFLSQPTLYIPNPPPTVKLQSIAAALNGYGTSIHSIFFISVRQRPRLGKFSGRSMRRRWVRVEFPSTEMAEQAYVTLHRKPIPGVSPQVLFNFRFTPYFPSVPCDVVAAPASAGSSRKRLGPRRDTLEAPSGTCPEARNVDVIPPVMVNGLEQDPTDVECSSSLNPPAKKHKYIRGTVEYRSLLEALKLDNEYESVGSNISQEPEQTDGYLDTPKRVLYPIYEDPEGECEEDVDVCSDTESLIEMAHKFNALAETQHELDSASITAEPEQLPVPALKSDPPTPTRSLRCTSSNILAFAEAVPKVVHTPAERENSQGYQQTVTSPEAQDLIDSQTSTINSLRKDFHDLLRAADSQTLIIEGLRNLIRQLEWDKADLVGMVESAREHGTRQMKLLQVQVEEMETRMGFMEARLNLAETKCRILEMNGKRVNGESLSEEVEQRELPELEASCQRFADMIAHDAHHKHLAARRERVRLREKLIIEQARRLREQEERRQIVIQEEAARKAHETEDRQRREKDRRRKLRREQAEARERKRCRERDIERWGKGEWTSSSALERFKLVLAEFETIPYADDQPLTTGAVPWPILTDPFELDSEDSGDALEELEWAMVETFFKEVVNLVDGPEYRSLLERTNLAFHPDRWKARRLLDTVVNEDVRGWLETKGNMVAQAVTPLWRESKRG